MSAHRLLFKSHHLLHEGTSKSSGKNATNQHFGVKILKSMHSFVTIRIFGKLFEDLLTLSPDVTVNLGKDPGHQQALVSEK